MSNDPSSSFSVLELRQYTLHPGRRDELIELFERYFLDGQEEAGVRIVGQFRDLDRPQHFVWLRAFRDMPARAEALAAFYGGPVWQAHRNAANATMIDSDDVLLLRPVDAGAAPVPTRAGLVVATVYLLAEPATDGFAQLFEEGVRPILMETGAPPIARLVTEYAENNFPRLPVRAGEHAFVWLAAFADMAAYERHLAALRHSVPWNEHVQPALRARLKSPAQVLRLAPTSFSHLGRGLDVGGRHDFDFLAGRWNVVSRRLAARGVASQEWNESLATCEAKLFLDGVANVDEFRLGDWSGMSVRAFDRVTRQWSIYWISSQRGILTPPVVGGFDGDRGEFFGEDEEGGRPVNVRFIWRKQGRDVARWEQAFSWDGGETWETNWIMELSRPRE